MLNFKVKVLFNKNEVSSGQFQFTYLISFIKTWVRILRNKSENRKRQRAIMSIKVYVRKGLRSRPSNRLKLYMLQSLERTGEDFRGPRLQKVENLCLIEQHMVTFVQLS